MTRDPAGKAALFGTGASPAGGSGPGVRPRGAASGDGPVLVTCSECGAHTRVTYRSLCRLLAMMSLWNPRRDHAHWLRCPACGRRNWCRLSL